MFGISVVLLAFALLTFGAVLPHSVLFFALLWCLAIGCFLVWHICRRPNLSSSVVISLICALLVLVFFPPRLAVGLVAGFCAYCAVSVNEKKTLRFLSLLLVVGCLEALLGLTQF